MKSILTVYIQVVAFMVVSTNGSRLGAQETSPPLVPGVPSLPYYINKAPAMSSWTVQYGELKGSEPSMSKDQTFIPPLQGRQIKEIKVVRTKSLRLVTVTYVDGKKDELWTDGSSFIERDDGSPPTLTSIAMFPDSLLQEYQLNDFPDFDSISKATYVDNVQIDNSECLMFRTKRLRERVIFENDMMEQQSTAKQDEEPVMIWINALTRLPVQWEQGNEIRKVIFETPPTEPLVFPKEISEMAEKMKKLQNIISPGG